MVAVTMRNNLKVEYRGSAQRIMKHFKRFQKSRWVDFIDKDKPIGKILERSGSVNKPWTAGFLLTAPAIAAARSTECACR